MLSLIDYLVAMVKRILGLLLGSGVMKLIGDVCREQGPRAW